MSSRRFISSSLPLHVEINALGGQEVDAVVVGGIGARAIAKLHAMGVKVYRAAAATAGQNIELFQQGKLAELTADGACAGHDHGHDCGHG